MSEVIRKYRDGEYIVREGEFGNEMYMIISGKVKIVKEKEGVETVLAHLGGGEIFGEMALFEEGKPRSASAVAHGDVTLMAMDKESFLREVRNNPAVALDILKSLCNRLRQVDEILQDFSVKDQRRQEQVRNFMRARGYL